MAEKEGAFVKWFSELSNKDIAVAGGKGASLAEMHNIKMPIPPGFVVTAQAYGHFITKTGTKEKIHEILSNLKVDNTSELHKASKEIREIIESQELPQEMKDEIAEAYDILDAKKEKGGEALNVLQKTEDPFVAVRSSATTEDLADASFAGQQETFLNVKGSEDLIEKVRKCMSSLFTPRAIFYREKKGFKHEQSLVAVVVQKMIDSNKSGVIFSQNPTKTDKNIVIEAVFGLGEGIVSGKIKPDHYVVSPELDNLKIVEQEVSNKKIAIVKNKEGKTETIKLEEEQAKKQVLNNYEIKMLSQYAKKLEEHYKKPQDIEFAIDESGIFIVQSRPITTAAKESQGEIEGEALLSGLAAAPGIGSGTVKIIKEISDLEKLSQGDVLVTEMTNPDMVVGMQKSSAIVTDEGGITSHAAIVSREMGIPAVVGTGDATTKLKEGDEITVDGSSGKVYAGKTQSKKVEILPIVETKTKIKVIADLPEGAERAAKSGSKAIGLTRLEGIIAIGGKHPLGFVKDKQTEKYVELLSTNLKKIIKPYEEIWVRSSDIRTDEYGKLEGAPKEDEANPMMGDHGIRFSLKNPEIFKAELQAVKQVAEEFPDKKIGLMVPLLISLDELKKAKAIAQEIGLKENIKIGIMMETPAAVQIIEELCEEGLDFISFGTNDLTQFTLAIDRNNEQVQKLFDETHPAVLAQIKQVIDVCKKHKVETSICGQAGSRPEVAKFLVENGIDSISVNADAAKKISEIVAQIEGGEAPDTSPPQEPESKEPEQEPQETPTDSQPEPEEEPETETPDQPPQEEPETETPEQPTEEPEEEPETTPPQKEDLTDNNEPQPITKPIKLQEKFEGKDMEDAILKELEDEQGDYQPGPANGDEDVPPLNEAIPVDSDSFKNMSNEEAEKEAEVALAEELLEELADLEDPNDKEPDEEPEPHKPEPEKPDMPKPIGEEWHGEKKHHHH